MRSTSLFTHGLTLGLCFGLLGLTACAPEDEPAMGTEETPAGETALNTLTEAEQAEGWELLFNGENFEGWRGFKAEEVAGVWSIEDDALYYNGDTTQAGDDLVTVETYDNFELSLEYKIAECGNSGIMYNVGLQGNAPYETGPEFQVSDFGCVEGAANDQNVPGSNYDMHQASVDAGLPVGEWNQARIIVNGDHVEHWLNGEMVVEYEMGSEDWQQRVDGSKWAEVPTYGTLGEGHIALQYHGHPVWYRNVKIHPLNGEAAEPTA